MRFLSIFFFVAVPIVTGFRFHVMYIGKGNIAIVGNRTGLPAVWDNTAIRKYWYKERELSLFERETETMSELSDIYD